MLHLIGNKTLVVLPQHCKVSFVSGLLCKQQVLSKLQKNMYFFGMYILLTMAELLHINE